MGCKGLHCEGCGHGGGLAAVVVALVVIVAVALHKAWPVIVAALEIAAWMLVSVCGAALVVTAGVLAVRLARRCRARRAALDRRGPVLPAVRLVAEHIETPAQRPAITRRPAAWPLPGRWEEIHPAHYDGPGQAS